MQATGNNKDWQLARLTIRVSKDTLCFSVVDHETEQQVIYEPYTVKSGISIAANLRQAFKESTLLQRGYKKVRVYIDSPVILVPIEEFHEEGLDKIYHYAISGHEADAIIYRVQPAINAVAVFAINKDLRLVVEDNFDDVRFTPIMQPVWNHLQQRSYAGNSHKLYGYFHDKKVEIFSFDKKRIRFYNSFPVTRAKDAVFFLLNVWQQLSMNQQKDELHLLGDIPEKEVLLANIKRYVAKAYSINPVAEFNRAPLTQIKNIPFDLLTLYLGS